MSEFEPILKQIKRDEQVTGNVTTYARKNHFPLITDGIPCSVIIGETHYNREYDLGQFYLAAQLRPSVILIESLRAFQFDPSTDELSLPRGRKVFKREEEKDRHNFEVSEYRMVSRRLGIPLVGCDLTRYEMFDALLRGRVSLTEDFYEEALQAGRMKTVALAASPEREYQMTHMIAKHKKNWS